MIVCILCSTKYSFSVGGNEPSQAQETSVQPSLESNTGVGTIGTGEPDKRGSEEEKSVLEKPKNPRKERK